MGDGSDGSSGDTGDGGVGSDGGAGYFNYGSYGQDGYDGGFAESSLNNALYANDEDQYRNKKYQGFGFGGGGNNWDIAGSLVNNGSNGVDMGPGSIAFSPVDQNLLNSIGYHGPMDREFSGSGENMQDMGQNAQYTKYLQDQGIQMGSRATDELGGHVTQAFKNGKGIGQQYNWNDSAFGDKDFGTAVGLLAAAGGGLAASGLAAGAGYGAGTAVGGAAAGAGAGFGGAVSQTADIGAGLKGAAIGGVTGGLVSGVNPAGMAGVTDPTYARAINGATNAGLRAGVGGGNVGSSVLNSLMSSGANIGGNAALGAITNMGDDNNFSDGGYSQDPYASQSTFDRNTGVQPSFSTSPGSNPNSSNGMDYGSFLQNSSPQGGYSQAPKQSTFDRLTGATAPEQNYSTAPGMNPDNPNMGSVSQYMGPGSTPGRVSPAAGGNPLFGMMKAAQGFMGGQDGRPGQAGNMASNLMDLYNRFKTNRDQGNLADHLSSLYGPNSPYAQRMGQVLMRADAKAGRRTQIAPRQIELQARLADTNARMAPTLNNIQNQQSNTRNAGLQDIYRMMSGGPNGGGGMGMLTSAGNSLSNYFSGGGGGGMMGANPAGDYNYQNGSDIGMADGGPVVGTRSPVRSGGGGGLSPEAVRQAVIRSAAPASSPNTYVTATNPAAANAMREQRQNLAHGGSVRGPGTARSDSIPANLSNGEHVIDAHSVNAIGGGDNALGQARLNAMRAKLHGRG